jgi:hypothetical protein
VSEVLTVKTGVLWDMTPCNLAGGIRFEGTEYRAFTYQTIWRDVPEYRWFFYIILTGSVRVIKKNVMSKACGTYGRHLRAGFWRETCEKETT